MRQELKSGRAAVLATPLTHSASPRLATWKEHVVTDPQSLTSAGATPTSVYLYFDRNDLLLYVGITGRGLARNSEHDASKEWWPYVTRQEIQHHPTRRSALSAERQMIRKYRPPFNVQHNPSHAAAREAYLTLATTPAGKVRDVMELIHHGHRKTRLPLDIRTVGAEHLILTADIIGWPHLDPSSAQAAVFEMLGADKKGGVKLVHCVTGDGARLIMHVRCRVNAQDCRSGEMLLRMPTKGQRNVTIKRVTLVAGGNTAQQPPDRPKPEPVRLIDLDVATAAELAKE